MPTVEERLAALEAKMAQLTDTRPTTYYTHQYSGEEIDAAVGRALTGGALDTSVTNISNQLGTFVRPNLLDNWYFGNPVDQLAGYIVPKGVNYYKVDGFVPQGPIPETVKVDYIDYAGSAIFNYGGAACYVPKDGGYVRGYTGNGYTVDRWTLYTEGGNVAISNGYLDIYSSKQYGTYLTQKIDPELAKALAGKTVTWSVLAVGGDIAFSANINKDDSYVDSFTIEPNTISFKTMTLPTDFTDISFVFAGNLAGHVCPIAAKLELGPTQTLAHKDAAGNWVLNEIPEYGGQLRRCQWYSNVLPGIYWLPQNADGTNRLTIPIPEMRTIPAVTYEPADGSTGTLYYDANLAQKNSIQFYAIGVTGICGVKNIRISADL